MAKAQRGKRSPPADPLTEQQNLVRGAISRLHSKRFDPSHTDELKVLRTSLVKSMFVARAALPDEDLEEYLDWFEQVVTTTAPELATKPIGYDYLAGFVDRVATVSLSRELRWAAKRLARQAASINTYLEARDAIQTLCLNSQHVDALKLLTDHTERFGTSYWSVTLQLALESAVGGLEQQKKFTDEVRKIYRRGLLSFLVYYLSVRNEERTTLPRYVEMIEQRLSKTKYQPDTQHYIRYRLFASWPETEKGLTDVLRVEQHHPATDIYETLVSCLQLIIQKEALHHLRPLAVECLADLRNVLDCRLDKLRYALGDAKVAAGLERRSSARADAIFAPGAHELELRAFKLGPERRDPWQIVYAAIAWSLTDRPEKRQLTLMDYRGLLASVLRRDAAAVANLGILEKNTLNLSGLPVAAAINGLCAELRNEHPKEFLPCSTVSLNSPAFGAEDTLLLDGAFEVAGDTPSLRFWRCVATGDLRGGLDYALESFARAWHSHRRGEYADAVTFLTLRPEEARGPLRTLCASLGLACFVQLADHRSGIRVIANEASENEVNPSFLPIAVALSELRWQDYKPCSEDLSAAIALDALWRATDDDSVATTLRFAFSYHLKKSGHSLPSEYADDDKFDRKRLIYFLRNVCVPSVMDMSPAFSSSRQVQEERQSVCASLSALDPARTEDYQSEIYSITNLLAVADGLRLVDSSRIHVDTDAISRWARRRLEEDFRRYSDLVTAGVGSPGDFEEILREVFASLGARQHFFTPDDQADAILTDMFFRLRDEFLSNSDYGLDYFLSKRVRHQSFIGLIRGPLEFEHLITTRESEFAPYRDNRFWLDQFKSLTPDEKSILNARLAKFSEDFDAALIKIKNEAFQIRSPECETGLFDITITNRMLFLMRSVAQAGIGFDDFLRVAFSLFWTALEPSLEGARNLITEHLKPTVVTLFDSLKQDIRVLTERDPAFPDLSTAIGNVSVDVQRNLDEAAQWFVRPEGQQGKTTFTLRQSVDIAVQSALKSHRAFAPAINVKVSGDAKLFAPDLLLLTDAIFVAIDNARAHSGIKREPQVSIICKVDPDTGGLSLVVTNSVAAGVCSQSAENALARIREVIAKGIAYSGARKEGGSGFVKIAAALRHSVEGRMEFGFKSDVEFEMVLEFRPTVYTVTVVGA